ncbi:unnamed protein product [Rotaria sp. Silwood1]|nr:unnamed protein product [Rotaria sp. Silwood1]CAF4973765.1 unnamed protein product [Rotaria sp. Silwood1]
MNTSDISPIIIRSYQSSDLSACKATILDGHKGYGNDIRYFNQAFETDMADIESNYLQVPNAHWWVAVSTDDNRIVGQVAVQPLRLGDRIYYEQAPSKERDEICELRRMSVAPDSQRHGIGSRLLTILLDFAREHGYRKVHLTTLTSMNKACAFYEKHGFVKGDIVRISFDETTVEKVMQCKEHLLKIFSNAVIFKHGDAIPEEDQQRMKLPLSISKYAYVQHYFLAL